MIITKAQGAGVTAYILQVGSRGVGHEVTSVGCHTSRTLSPVLTNLVKGREAVTLSSGREQDGQHQGLSIWPPVFHVR